MAETSILDPQVAATLDALGFQYEVLACDPSLADTAEFCAHYGISPEEACNAIVVAKKTTPREYVACLVRADSRLDVNHRVSEAVAFKRLSFASAEETAALSGMMIGGVTIIGLPPSVPILIDSRVLERDTVILGGGNRSSKIRLDPKQLERLPNARIAQIAVPRA
ncbi:MAG TPA: YbaK/EbsC family protein [Thermoanaerobaculia bacterium]|jgi:prolyl-tRNA editing enzyme YbaK/EbsC (Cys-tRNA(Pro) deacylase)